MSRQPPAPKRKPSYNRRSDTPRLLSLRQAAEYLGLAPNTVKKYVDQGRIRCYRIGDRPLVKFDPADLDIFLAQQVSA